MKKAEHELLVRRMPRMSDEEYWTLFAELYRESPKEYLVTLLRGLGQRDVLSSEVFASLAPLFSDVDRQKILQRLLPSYADPADIERLLTLVGLTERREWIAHLVRVEGKAAAFVLLRALRCVEDDRELLLRVARFLLRRGDALSFNVASLMRLSFGLDELRGTFSLQLQPWQLDKMEQDWAYFSRQMNL